MRVPRQCRKHRCDATYDAVCGTDGNTYINRCMMLYMGCLRGDMTLRLVHKGECRDEVIVTQTSVRPTKPTTITTVLTTLAPTIGVDVDPQTHPIKPISTEPTTEIVVEPTDTMTATILAQSQMPTTAAETTVESVTEKLATPLESVITTKLPSTQQAPKSSIESTTEGITRMRFTTVEEVATTETIIESTTGKPTTTLEARTTETLPSIPQIVMQSTAPTTDVLITANPLAESTVRVTPTTVEEKKPSTGTVESASDTLPTLSVDPMTIEKLPTTPQPAGSATESVTDIITKRKPTVIEETTSVEKTVELTSETTTTMFKSTSTEKLPTVRLTSKLLPESTAEVLTKIKPTTLDREHVGGTTVETSTDTPPTVLETRTTQTSTSTKGTLMLSSVPTTDSITVMKPTTEFTTQVKTTNVHENTNRVTAVKSTTKTPLPTSESTLTKEVPTTLPTLKLSTESVTNITTTKKLTTIKEIATDVTVAKSKSEKPTTVEVWTTVTSPSLTSTPLSESTSDITTMKSPPEIIVTETQSVEEKTMGELPIGKSTPTSSDFMSTEKLPTTPQPTKSSSGGPTLTEETTSVKTVVELTTELEPISTETLPTVRQTSKLMPESTDVFTKMKPATVEETTTKATLGSTTETSNSGLQSITTARLPPLSQAELMEFTTTMKPSTENPEINTAVTTLKSTSETAITTSLANISEKYTPPLPIEVTTIAITSVKSESAEGKTVSVTTVEPTTSIPETSSKLPPKSTFPQTQSALTSKVATVPDAIVTPFGELTTSTPKTSTKLPPKSAFFPTQSASTSKMATMQDDSVTPIVTTESSGLPGTKVITVLPSDVKEHINQTSQHTEMTSITKENEESIVTTSAPVFNKTHLSRAPFGQSLGPHTNTNFITTSVPPSAVSGTPGTSTQSIKQDLSSTAKVTSEELRIETISGSTPKSLKTDIVEILTESSTRSVSIPTNASLITTVNEKPRDQTTKVTLPSPEMQSFVTEENIATEEVSGVQSSPLFDRATDVMSATTHEWSFTTVSVEPTKGIEITTEALLDTMSDSPVRVYTGTPGVTTASSQLTVGLPFSKTSATRPSPTETALTDFSGTDIATETFAVFEPTEKSDKEATQIFNVTQRSTTARVFEATSMFVDNITNTVTTESSGLLTSPAITDPKYHVSDQNGETPIVEVVDSSSTDEPEMTPMITQLSSVATKKPVHLSDLLTVSDRATKISADLFPSTSSPSSVASTSSIEPEEASSLTALPTSVGPPFVTVSQVSISLTPTPSIPVTRSTPKLTDGLMEGTTKTFGTKQAAATTTGHFSQTDVIEILTESTIHSVQTDATFMPIVNKELIDQSTAGTLSTPKMEAFVTEEDTVTEASGFPPSPLSFDYFKTTPLEGVTDVASVATDDLSYTSAPVGPASGMEKTTKASLEISTGSPTQTSPIPLGVVKTSNSKPPSELPFSKTPATKPFITKTTFSGFQKPTKTSDIVETTDKSSMDETRTQTVPTQISDITLTATNAEVFEATSMFSEIIKDTVTTDSSGLLTTPTVTDPLLHVTELHRETSTAEVAESSSTNEHPEMIFMNTKPLSATTEKLFHPSDLPMGPDDSTQMSIDIISITPLPNGVDVSTVIKSKVESSSIGLVRTEAASTSSTEPEDVSSSTALTPSIGPPFIAVSQAPISSTPVSSSFMFTSKSMTRTSHKPIDGFIESSAKTSGKELTGIATTKLHSQTDNVEILTDSPEPPVSVKTESSQTSTLRQELRDQTTLTGPQLETFMATEDIVTRNISQTLISPQAVAPSKTTTLKTATNEVSEATEELTYTTIPFGPSSGIEKTKASVNTLGGSPMSISAGAPGAVTASSKSTTDFPFSKTSVPKPSPTETSLTDFSSTGKATQTYDIVETTNKYSTDEPEVQKEKTQISVVTQRPTTSVENEATTVFAENTKDRMTTKSSGFLTSPGATDPKSHVTELRGETSTAEFAERSSINEHPEMTHMTTQVFSDTTKKVFHPSDFFTVSGKATLISADIIPGTPFPSDIDVSPVVKSTVESSSTGHVRTQEASILSVKPKEVSFSTLTPPSGGPPTKSVSQLSISSTQVMVDLETASKHMTQSTQKPMDSLMEGTTKTLGTEQASAATIGQFSKTDVVEILTEITTPLVSVQTDANPTTIVTQEQLDQTTVGTLSAPKMESFVTEDTTEEVKVLSPSILSTISSKTAPLERAADVVSITTEKLSFKNVTTKELSHTAEPGSPASDIETIAKTALDILEGSPTLTSPVPPGVVKASSKPTVKIPFPKTSVTKPFTTETTLNDFQSTAKAFETSDIVETTDKSFTDENRIQSVTSQISDITKRPKTSGVFETTSMFVENTKDTMTTEASGLLASIAVIDPSSNIIELHKEKTTAKVAESSSIDEHPETTFMTTQLSSGVTKTLIHPSTLLTIPGKITKISTNIIPTTAVLGVDPSTVVKSTVESSSTGPVETHEASTVSFKPEDVSSSTALSTFSGPPMMTVSQIPVSSTSILAKLGTTLKPVTQTTHTPMDDLKESTAKTLQTQPTTGETTDQLSQVETVEILMENPEPPVSIQTDASQTSILSQEPTDQTIAVTFPIVEMETSVTKENTITKDISGLPPSPEAIVSFKTTAPEKATDVVLMATEKLNYTTVPVGPTSGIEKISKASLEISAGSPALFSGGPPGLATISSKSTRGAPLFKTSVTKPSPTGTTLIDFRSTAKVTATSVVEAQDKSSTDEDRMQSITTQMSDITQRRRPSGDFEAMSVFEKNKDGASTETSGFLIPPAVTEPASVVTEPVRVTPIMPIIQNISDSESAGTTLTTSPSSGTTERPGQSTEMPINIISSTTVGPPAITLFSKLESVNQGQEPKAVSTGFPIKKINPSGVTSAVSSSITISTGIDTRESSSTGPTETLTVSHSSSKSEQVSYSTALPISAGPLLITASHIPQSSIVSESVVTFTPVTQTAQKASSGFAEGTTRRVGKGLVTADPVLLSDPQTPRFLSSRTETPEMPQVTPAVVTRKPDDMVTTMSVNSIGDSSIIPPPPPTSPPAMPISATEKKGLTSPPSFEITTKAQFVSTSMSIIGSESKTASSSPEKVTELLRSQSARVGIDVDNTSTQTDLTTQGATEVRSAPDESQSTLTKQPIASTTVSNSVKLLHMDTSANVNSSSSHSGYHEPTTPPTTLNSLLMTSSEPDTLTTTKPQSLLTTMTELLSRSAELRQISTPPRTPQGKTSQKSLTEKVTMNKDVPMSTDFNPRVEFTSPGSIEKSIDFTPPLTKKSLTTMTTRETHKSATTGGPWMTDLVTSAMKAVTAVVSNVGSTLVPTNYRRTPTEISNTGHMETQDDKSQGSPPSLQLSTSQIEESILLHTTSNKGITDPVTTSEWSTSTALFTFGDREGSGVKGTVSDSEGITERAQRDMVFTPSVPATTKQDYRVFQLGNPVQMPTDRMTEKVTPGVTQSKTATSVKSGTSLSSQLATKIQPSFHPDPRKCPHCEPDVCPVCGSDGKTYQSACELKRVACLRGSITLVAEYSGDCIPGLLDLVNGKTSCGHFVCPSIYNPICGSGHMTFNNDCSLIRAQLCIDGMKDLVKVHHGECEDFLDIKADKANNFYL
ncbi:mucin-2-like isoform X2 [Acanthaster planci]|nr:mucin-2-like isoform X2 [Acanthaster planci]